MIRNQQGRIYALKEFWAFIHSLLKPTADAHTLTIPGPLFTLASRHLRQISGFSESNIVLLLTPELMYYQQPHSRLRDWAEQISSYIPSVAFPKQLGFVQIPFSQGPRLFTNLIIYHEIGHYVFEEIATDDKHTQIRSELENAIEATLNNLKLHLSSVPGPDFTLLCNTFESWTNEIFCDLFATRILGPAYSFAFLEFSSMLQFLSDESAAIFSAEHPADAYRLKQQLKMLELDGWLPDTELFANRYARRIRELSKIPETRYSLMLDGEQFVDAQLFQRFEQIPIEHLHARAEHNRTPKARYVELQTASQRSGRMPR